MVVSTPSAIDKKYVTTDTDTEGYINAYLTISFNGETYTNLDYAVYYTFYQTPRVARSFLYFGETAKRYGNSYKYVPYGSSGTFADANIYTPISAGDQSGVYDDPAGERHQLYVYINGTGVFLRSSKVVVVVVGSLLDRSCYSSYLSVCVDFSLCVNPLSMSTIEFRCLPLPTTQYRQRLCTIFYD